MSPNPNPTKQSDYRTIDNPKLRTRNVLVWLNNHFADGGLFTADVVSKHFGIPHADAARRMSRLKSWGCIKFFRRGKGAVPHLWQISAWGIKCAKRWAIANETNGQEK